MTPVERRRLAGILGMLGSEHAGERASAALHAEAFRKQHGLTWAELLASPPVEVTEAAPEPVWTPPRPPQRPVRPETPRPRPRQQSPPQSPFVGGKWTAVAYAVACIGGAILINIF